MANFREIDEARRLLGLREDATLEEIRKAFRGLAREYHPDKCQDGKKKDCEERFKRIAAAKDILMEYCAGYRYSFHEKDAKKNTMDRETYDHLKRFYDGWLGDLDL